MSREKEDIESELIEDQNSSEEVQLRVRQDLTAEYSASLRRLDTLARLLSGHSQCVAVMIYDNTLYVTANELFKTSRENNNKMFIGNVIEYYGKLAKAETVSAEERNQIFKSICSKQRFGKASVPEIISTKVLNALLANQMPDFRDFLKLYDINAGAAGLAWGVFTRLYRDFIKFEKSVKAEAGIEKSSAEESSVDDIDIMKILSLALKSKKTEILTQELKTGVHAEVQMLSFLVKNINKNKMLKNDNVYIGISKLCCMSCRVMLNVANKVFKEKGINVTLEFRGKHDLDFGKWTPPAVFQAGFEEKDIQDKNTIEYQIGFRSKQEIDELMKESKPSGVSMEASQSSSDTEIFEEDIINKRKQELKRQLIFLNSIYKMSGNIGLKETLDAVLIALKIQDLSGFVDLLQIKPSKTTNERIAVDNFIVLWKQLETLATSMLKISNSAASASSFSSAAASELTTVTLTPDILLKILQNSTFCGKLSEYFLTLNSDSVKKINTIVGKQIVIPVEPITLSSSNTTSVAAITESASASRYSTFTFKDVKMKAETHNAAIKPDHHTPTASNSIIMPKTNASASSQSEIDMVQPSPSKKPKIFSSKVSASASASASGSGSYDEAVKGKSTGKTARF